MGNLLVFIIPIFVLLVVVCLIASWKQAKKRRLDLAALASALGLTYQPQADHSRDEQFSQFSVFNHGRSRTAWNTLTGTRLFDEHELEVVMGDYRYTVDSGHGKNRRSHTYRLSYLATRLPNPSTPSVVVRPETFFDKFAGMIGFDDIDFESVEFSKRFHVASSDKRFAYDLIDPRMMEFLLAEAPKLLDMEGGWVLVLDGKRRWKPAEFSSTLAWLNTWFEHWPTHVERSLIDGGYAGVEA